MQRTAWGVYLVALATLILELALTRVFDVVLMPSLSYMVITCAVFAFGLAGLYATLWPLANSGPAGAVAWAWALNGIFTVVGGLLAVLLSMAVGFTWTLLIAMAVYVLAFGLFARIRAPGEVLDRAEVGTGELATSGMAAA